MGNISDSEKPYTEYRWIRKIMILNKDNIGDIYSPISIDSAKEVENKLKLISSNYDLVDKSNISLQQYNDIKASFIFTKNNQIEYTANGKTYIRTEIPVNNYTIFRKDRYINNCFNKVIPYQTNFIDSLKVYYYSNCVFDETTVDNNDNFIVEFTNHLCVLNDTFANQYFERLKKYLIETHNINKDKFTLVKLRNILAKDFSSCKSINLIPYTQYFIRNLYEYNFKDIIVQILIEEGKIYDQINEILKGNFINDNLLFYILCLLYIIGAKSNREDLTKAYIYLHKDCDLSLFIKKNIIYNTQLITACKIKNYFNNEKVNKSKAIIEINFESKEDKNWYLNFKGIDCNSISQYQTENMIIIQPFSIFEVIESKQVESIQIIKLIMKTNCLNNLSKIRMSNNNLNQIGLYIIEPKFREDKRIINNYENIASLTIYSDKQYLLNSLSEIGSLCNLRVLNLSNLELTDDNIETIAPYLYGLTYLNYLNLSLNNISINGISTLSVCLSFMPYLEHLYLNQNNIGDNGVKKLAQILPKIKQLRSLSLIYNQIRYSGLEQIIYNLKSCEQIDTLIFSTNFIYFEFYEDLEELLSNVKTMKNLVNLDFSNNQICNDGFKILTEYMPSTLQRLNLSENEITQDGLMDFSLNLIKFPNLLEFNYYGNRNGPTGLNYFVDNLGYIPNLEIINFGCNYISDSDILLLSSGFEKLKNLKILILKENNITNDGVMFLSKYLPELDNLTTLDLGCNLISDNPFNSEFYENITNLKFFQSFILENNDISKDYFVCILNDLKALDSNWNLNREVLYRTVFILYEDFADKYIPQIKIPVEEKIDDELKIDFDSII